MIDLKTGWKVDLIIRKARAFSQEEFRRRKSVMTEGITIWIASPEDTVISKLEWAKLSESRRQIEDATAILNVRWNSLDHNYLEKWIEQLDLKKEWQEVLQGRLTETD